MKNDEFKNPLKKHLNKKGTYAFIVGNGINRAYSKDNSWSKLLKKLIKNDVFDENKKNNLESNSSNCFSFLEIYDFINSNGKIEEKKFRDDLVDLIKEIYPVEKIDGIIRFRNALINANYSILTTNYDSRFDEGLEPFGKKTPYRYPWNYCYIEADKNKLSSTTNDTLNRFAVWHINGTVDLSYSIRLGIDDYAGLFARERKFYAGSDNYKKNHPIPTKDTWLDVFYKKPLCIVGLGLGKDEVFLRHLLMKRYKYRNSKNCKNTCKNTSKDIFICMNEKEEVVDFLNLLNFETIFIKYKKPYKYRKMYNLITEVLNEIK